MRVILLNVVPDLGHEVRLSAAIALAQSHQGHICCLQTLIQPFDIGHPQDTIAVPEMMRTVEWSADAFRAEVEARLDDAGVTWAWLELYGDPATMIVNHSRLADIVVLSAEGSYPNVDPVASHTRVPILVARHAGAAFQVRAPVLIAWNGSPPAAQALRGSVPLLRDTERVHILAVDRDSNDFPATRAAEYLSHHEIPAEVHWQHSDGKTVGQTILDFARQLGAGTLVAGAFGHNRIREMLLGSVTRSMLRDSQLPLLLAH